MDLNVEVIFHMRGSANSYDPSSSKIIKLLKNGRIVNKENVNEKYQCTECLTWISLRHLLCVFTDVFQLFIIQIVVTWLEIFVVLKVLLIFVILSKFYSYYFYSSKWTFSFELHRSIQIVRLNLTLKASHQLNTIHRWQ